MVVVYIAQFIPVVPALFALKKWRCMNLQQRWFTVLLWSIVLISFSGELYLYSAAGDQINMPFFHVYILVEYLLLLQVFRHMFLESISRKVWRILAGGFVLVWFINVFKGEGWWGFPDYIHALEAIVILALVVKWFLKMLAEKVIASPIRTFEFWMCAGILIYFLGNFVLFLFPKFLINAGKAVFELIWKMNCILIIILYLSYTVALFWVKKADT